MITSCGIFKKKDDSNPEKAKNDEVKISRSVIADLVVQPESLGDLKLGKTLDQLNLENWINFDRDQVDAGFFGFDGGGKARLYSYKSEPIIAILKKENKKIKAIIAIHPDIKTNESISVQSSLNEIKAAYPNGKLKDDQMNKWSIYEIPAKKWQFIFDARLDEISGDERSQFLIIR